MKKLTWEQKQQQADNLLYEQAIDREWMNSDEVREMGLDRALEQYVVNEDESPEYYAELKESLIRGEQQYFSN